VQIMKAEQHLNCSIHAVQHLFKASATSVQVSRLAAGLIAACPKHRADEQQAQNHKCITMNSKYRLAVLIRLVRPPVHAYDVDSYSDVMCYWIGRYMHMYNRTQHAAST
jgi:post-segregation antitoxin (ccd killing protein)